MKLSALFTDGCVLRMGGNTKIWGTAEPGERVTVFFQNKTYTSVANSSGAWRAAFDELSAGGAFELRVESKSGEIVLKDIYVGEVWLCAGQSNMQITFARIGRKYPEVLSAPPEPKIRYFLIEPSFSSVPEQEINAGKWRHAAPEHISDMTAVGYFFAKRRQERTGVPVGLITAAVGGTAISSWQKTPFAVTKAIPARNGIPKPGEPCDPTVTQGGGGVIWWHKQVMVPEQFAGQTAELALGTIIDSDIAYVNGVEIGRTEYRYPPRYYNVPPLSAGVCEIVVRQTINGAWGKFTEGKTRELRFAGGGVIPLTGDWRRRREHQERLLPKDVKIPPEFIPGAYYNAMISPLTNYALTGALWYQGESDASAPWHYAETFSHMLNDWRGAWEYDFPMLTVGLARWDEADWTELREQQKICAELPGVGYFDAWEYGEPNDLHPLAKKPIGEGLADVSFMLGI